MQLIHDIASLRLRLANEVNVVFVPTMGNLHQGHLSLVEQARQQPNACVVVSVFVNPLQFGPNEDFDAYPRTLTQDCALLAEMADVVFAPAVNEMYPTPQTVLVEPPVIANELCGAARPGHFRGMATVVLKLLNMVQPQRAIFGKKDYQQLMIVRQMVAQLNLPIEIIGGETVRAADGLALSSRNQYLTPEQRAEAVCLYQQLRMIQQQVLTGARDFAALEQQAMQQLTSRGWLPDYISIRRQQDLAPASAQDRQLVIVAAAKLGRTRLLDNLELGL